MINPWNLYFPLSNATFFTPLEIDLLAIIQVRTGSTRLPNKILKKINGKTITQLIVERLSNSSISKVMVCNTIDISQIGIFPKLEVINVAEVFGQSIKRIVDGTSLSSMFKKY